MDSGDYETEVSTSDQSVIPLVVAFFTAAACLIASLCIERTRVEMLRLENRQLMQRKAYGEIVPARPVPMPEAEP